MTTGIVAFVLIQEVGFALTCIAAPHPALNQPMIPRSALSEGSLDLWLRDSMDPHISTELENSRNL